MLRASVPGRIAPQTRFAASQRGTRPVGRGLEEVMRGGEATAPFNNHPWGLRPQPPSIEPNRGWQAGQKAASGKEGRLTSWGCLGGLPPTLGLLPFPPAVFWPRRGLEEQYHKP